MDFSSLPPQKKQGGSTEPARGCGMVLHVFKRVDQNVYSDILQIRSRCIHIFRGCIAHTGTILATGLHSTPDTGRADGVVN
jgi:hypothetical protein